MHKIEYWSSQPSQLLNMGVFLSSILVVTLPLAYLRWKSLKGTKYSLQGDKIIVESDFMGFQKNSFSINEVERITVHQPVFYKLFSLNNILITIRNGESIVFAGVKNAGEFTKALNNIAVYNQELVY